MARIRLRRLQRLPTPDGLHRLADEVDPSQPEGLDIFLRAAAIEIELSRSRIRKLRRKLRKK